jgi:hypothetical protein
MSNPWTRHSSSTRLSREPPPSLSCYSSNEDGSVTGAYTNQGAPLDTPSANLVEGSDFVCRALRGDIREALLPTWDISPPADSCKTIAWQVPDSDATFPANTGMCCKHCRAARIRTLLSRLARYFKSHQHCQCGSGVSCLGPQHYVDIIC